MRPPASPTRPTGSCGTATPGRPTTARASTWQRTHGVAAGHRPARRHRRLPPGGGETTDCPATLGCEWIPAPYEHYGTSPGHYGNHDLADRPHDPSIDYIVIHDTEGAYDPRSTWSGPDLRVAGTTRCAPSDGHVAEHVEPDDVAWHAGNWYVNCTRSASSTRGSPPRERLVHRGDVPLVGRAGALPRRQVRHPARPCTHHRPRPGAGHGCPSTVAGMHWDPGPYWDWEHYMQLLGAPIGGEPAARRRVARDSRPGFSGNEQPVTGCCRPPVTRARRRPPTSSTCTSVPTPTPRWCATGAAPRTATPAPPRSPTSARAWLPARCSPSRSGDRAGSGSGGSARIGWIANPADRPVLVPDGGQHASPRQILGDPCPSTAARTRSSPPTPPASRTRRSPRWSTGSSRGSATRWPTRRCRPTTTRAKTFDGPPPGDHTVVRGPGPLLPDLVRAPGLLRPRGRRHPDPRS